MKINRSKTLLVMVFVLLDIFFISVSLKLAYQIRFFSAFTAYYPAFKGIPEWTFYLHTLYFIIPLWLFILYEQNFYKIFFVKPIDELIRVGRAVVTGIFFTLLGIFFYREFSVSRLVFLIFCVNVTLTFFLYRQLLKSALIYFMRSFVGREAILVFGKNNKTLKIIFKQHPHLKVFYLPADDISDITRAKHMAVERNVNQIILTHHQWDEKTLLKFYDWCENRQIALKFIPDIVHICRGEIAIDSSLGLPIFQLKPVSLRGFNFYFKRIVDLVISILFLSAIWPVLLTFAILIKLDSPGPFLYQHKRMGYRGTTFNFFKYRTMVTDADKLLEQFKYKSERKGPVFKMSNDPRVTKLGKFLRRYSLDEFPQLLNVLRGEMSLVGPRPQVLWEAAAYDDWAKRRLRVLPGITGLWQVSGRASLSYEEMIELDIYYIENWTLGMDIEILLKTLPAIFSKKGAY
jgi:exopolysaccharide biosynthesis polyprenyl glycosylphosphotransferase